MSPDAGRTLVLEPRPDDGPRTYSPPITPAPAAPPPPLAPPFVPRRSAQVFDGERRMAVPLRQSFRFIHEPVSARSPAQFVGRQTEIESLADRILFSEGGSFLVTGYRGVGKTSFVNQVIRKLEDEAPRATPVLGDTEIVDVYLNVARPMQPSEMMHHVIRRLNDRIVERGIYEHLDDDLRDALKLAYDRTSVNMARKVAEASERSFGVNEASLGGDWMKAAMKLSWTSKRSRSSNYETSYLGYDDKAAEHDVISLSRRLAAGYSKRASRLERVWRALRRGSPRRRRLKIIFVFDELDKLEEFTVATADDKAPQKPAIDVIIGSLKNLFTTSGVSFIFVAGKDLQERWLEDVGRGDSVYESVFAYDKYLPCLWSDVGSICDAFVDRGDGLGAYPAQIFDAFKKYLTYRGRGIPRRIIRTFNQYVEWDDNQPSLRFAAHDVRRVRFFAGLQSVVDAHERTLFGESLEEFSGTQSDKRRLGVYYLIDWILGRGTIDFTLKDVLEASRRLSVKIALAEEIAPRVAEDILSVLVEADYIQVARKNLTQVFIQPATGDVQKRYRVSPRRLVEMGGDRDGAEADVLVGLSAKDVFAERERMPQSVASFRIIREIGRGGMGVVYEGIDEHHGQRVAVKVLNDSLTSQGDLAKRFEREAMILKSLEHPNIVRLVAWGREALRLYIAMEFLDGVTVEEVIRRSGRLPLDVVVAIAEPVARAGVRGRRRRRAAVPGEGCGGPLPVDEGARRHARVAGGRRRGGRSRDAGEDRPRDREADRRARRDAHDRRRTGRDGDRGVPTVVGRAARPTDTEPCSRAAVCAAAGRPSRPRAGARARRGRREPHPVDLERRQHDPFDPQNDLRPQQRERHRAGRADGLAVSRPLRSRRRRLVRRGHQLQLGDVRQRPAAHRAPGAQRRRRDSHRRIRVSLRAMRLRRCGRRRRRGAWRPPRRRD
jgi:serine/threonine-protein kinase